MKQQSTNKKRVRGTLLVLLWIWAICIFVVLDLFLNVDEFDRIRPRARVYRSMRLAAHDMVDEPYYDNDFGPSRAGHKFLIARRTHCVAPVSAQARYLADELERIRELPLSELHATAQNADDPRVRIAALRSMARRGGSHARPAIVAMVHNESETNKVRVQAALLVGRTGAGSLPVLNDLIGSIELPGAVREGAVRGLGELGSADATRRLLHISAGDPALRSAADKGVARVRRPEGVTLLLDAAQDTHLRDATRVAACQAIGRSKQPGVSASLAPLIADATQPGDVRAAAVRALGLLGQQESAEVVRAAVHDRSPQVAREARLARARIRPENG